MILKRFDVRTIVGVGLILLGGLMFLEKLGFLHGAGGLFWGLVFLAGAAYFFYMYSLNPRNQWWPIIPGMFCLGVAGETFIPAAFSGWGGAWFLGAIGLAFWIVYLTDRMHWWAVIPGGVLWTLAAISVLDGRSSDGTGSFFFLGLALTFVLVAILPSPMGRRQWAYIPAGVLAVFGLLLSTSMAGFAGYVWPAVLIIAGVLIIFGFFSSRQ